MASETANVARKLNEAKETQHLDLSNCGLTKIPDAVYLMLKNTTLESGNLSGNLLTKVPPKFFTKLKSLKELDLSNNKLTTLPTEIDQLQDLQVLNLSCNCLELVPESIYDCANHLKELNLKGNSISDVDVDRLKDSTTLTTVNFQENPILDEFKLQLSANCNFTVLLD